MMQDAYRKRVIKLARQRQMIDVGLDNVRVRQAAGGVKRRLYRRAEIDADDVASTPLRSELRVTSFAAPALEHNLVAEKLRCDGRDPTEKLFGVALVDVGEMLPLPTKILS